MDTQNDDSNQPDEQARFVMTAGDRLRACDFAVALRQFLQDGDSSKVWGIVVETQLSGDTIADGLARMQNLLLAYTYLSVPLDEESIEQIRKHIVEEEIRRMDFGEAGQ